MNDTSVTVVLNGFKRGKNLLKQIDAIKKQSAKVNEIMLWYNSPGSFWRYSFRAIWQTKASVSNHNFGVWSRFYYALNAKTTYVCVLDDDTIPGSKWIENCLNTIQTHKGLLGTIGVNFNSCGDYYSHTRVGWANPNQNVEQVDIVGHAWFFERKWLSAFCRELPDSKYTICGEDMHFSYMLQKYLRLNTYVPPHPESDKEMWGSLKGWKLGMDSHAISLMHKKKKNNIFVNNVNEFFISQVHKGWKLINAKERQNFMKDFDKVKKLLEKQVPFAFNRFSDGELFILQNKRLVLCETNTIVDANTNAGPVYEKEDHKDFNPQEHSFVREKLMDAFKFNSKNYFKGLSCKCCVGQKNFKWQKEVLHGNIKNCTWANLLVNANYPRFLDEILPLIKQYKTVMICNDKADLSNLDFIVKDFRVGYNAMVNDIHKIDEIKKWVKGRGIEGHLFLFSASSFSKIAIYELYKDFPENTYIDIGTTLNHLIGMSTKRSYLGEYHRGETQTKDLQKICIW
ncbi:MAG: hypothetical protein ACI9CD_000490 [Candidatus Deianiraeaceae bacterium]|jgi:hypothetical protein